MTVAEHEKSGSWRLEHHLGDFFPLPCPVSLFDADMAGTAHMLICNLQVQHQRRQERHCSG